MGVLQELGESSGGGVFCTRIETLCFLMAGGATNLAVEVAPLVRIAPGLADGLGPLLHHQVMGDGFSLNLGRSLRLTGKDIRMPRTRCNLQRSCEGIPLPNFSWSRLPTSPRSGAVLAGRPANPSHGVWQPAHCNSLRSNRSVASGSSLRRSSPEIETSAHRKNGSQKDEKKSG